MKTNIIKLKIGLMLALALTVAQAASAFYNPNLGRWLNRDPLGDIGNPVVLTTPRPRLETRVIAVEQADGPNPYTFVHNDPLLFLDPFGLDIIVNNSGGPLLVDGNPGQGHGTGGFQYSVVPPDGKQWGGKKHPIQCFSTPQAAFQAYSNNLQTVTPFLYDIDGYYNTSGRVRVRGDDEGPVTTVGPGGKISDRDGRVGAAWRYIWRE